MKIFLKKLAIAPVRIYQWVISPYLPKSCRYYPSCSAYAIEAIERHGVVKGWALAMARIGRCHPFSTHCYHDPVPSAFTWGDLLRYKRRNTKKEEIRAGHPNAE